MYQTLILSVLLVHQVQGYCPPTGPVFPPPLIDGNTELSNLSASLDALSLSNGSTSFNSTTTSFSVSITSSNATFFEFHHTAPVKNESGVQRVDKHTTYRIASNTKLFMVLATLLEFPNVEDSTEKYVSELVNDTRYNDITLKMLTSQISGVPRDGNLLDWWTLAGKPLEQLGFPVPSPESLPGCDAGPGSTGPGALPCTRDKFFANFLADKLTWQAGDKLTYTDQAFILLGFAVEQVTNKPYQQVIKDKILTPLGLNSTTFETPASSQAIVPVGQGSGIYALDISNFKAAAGLYSTPSDMITFIRGLLTHRLLSPAKTRSWLRPITFTSSLTTAVGAPWEIYRTVSSSLDKRPINMHTKHGDFGGYAAWLILIPEYDVGIQINAAGDEAYPAAKTIFELMAAKLIPALEELSRKQAKSRYGGEYQSGNDTVTLTVGDGPGLKMVNWTIGGQDIFNGLTVIAGQKDNEARIYPVGEGNRWKMVLEAPDMGTAGLFEAGCPQWLDGDHYRYRKQPLNEFDFETDDDGSDKSVTNLGLRSTMSKKSKVLYRDLRK